MKTWKIQTHNDPWPYIIIDNYMPEGDFQDLLAEKDPFIMQIHSPITPDFIEKFFPQHRKYDTWELKCEIQTSEPFSEYPIHDEAARKVVSCIHYLSPEENVGTEIYDKDKNYVTTVEWKPNRALIFAGMDGITWHSYKNDTSLPRTTANTFFIRTGSRPD